ncbi:class I SAM-dependent methyltransferase [Fodinicola feengrottensis]|uniref:Class I SAM-dependent methyltransferase n=1 Tax=Fodinicola feengrottensis TaxID=435914 RepID=A0ABN2G3E4_9ACTN
MTDTVPAASESEFWEAFYQEKEQVWSGKPNPLLVREVESLSAGRALDLGCAEGADAIWLAQRGWQVTAVDISETALKRAVVRAADAGVPGITWERWDLSQSFPEGLFDLVSAQFFHSPVGLDQNRVKTLRRAAEAVAPGGVLLIVGHAGFPAWVENPPPVRLPSTAELMESLGFDPNSWKVELEDVVGHDMPGPDGQPGTREDNVLRMRRLR